MGKMDIWYGFACHGLDMLISNGVLCFIAQNNWTTSSGARKMRDKIIRDAYILQLLDFNDYMIFENADIQTMVMFFVNNKVIDNYVLDYRTLEKGAIKEDMFALLKKQKRNNITIYKMPIIERSKYANKLLTFSNDGGIFEKIAKNKADLQSKELAQGIVFPQDFLDKKGAKKLNNIYPIGTGIFGLSDEEKSTLDLSENEQYLIKPYYTTEQIHRYYTDPHNSKWLIYTDSSFKKGNSMKRFPHLKIHLDQFIGIFTSDNKPYGLHRCRNEFFFKGEKIISLRKCVGRPCFSYSDFDCYVTQTFFSIKSSRWDMKFLTGLLNSKLVAFWLRNKGKMQGSNYQIDKAPLQEIPLPLASFERQQEIIMWVDEILAKVQDDIHANIKEQEDKIDILVYHLYNLTYDEILIIDPEILITREEYDSV